MSSVSSLLHCYSSRESLNVDDSDRFSSYTQDGEFIFDPPPEAPVFEPTHEEFQNPLSFIHKIRPVAEQYGICKIRPPPDWKPPFALDVDKFKFVPRVQRLNELEATTRIKLNFFDQIAKFWELQGSSLKIPMVERKALDLFSLHRIVQREGGLEAVNKDKKWPKIVQKMGLPAKSSFATLLKNHYERILYPFDIFRQEKASGDDKKSESDTDLKKGLKFLGGGPKMAGYQLIKDEKPKSKRLKKIILEDDPLAKYVCHKCERGDAEDFMLLCDGCDDSYHTFCLMPPLLEIPKGDWRCPECVKEEVSKPTEAFGFEQAQREYTLQQFGDMADQFKSDYFNMPAYKVPTNSVEKEFWRVVSSIEEDVTVEYGADLHTMDHGSGFPTKQSLTNRSVEEEDIRKYAECGWNLTNLPVLEGSVLSQINADISGMKVPWIYVGMCFAAFCWHNEDHWTYSINYLHWGEAKTWYGVSGSKAELFEAAMKSSAPELFESQPDLLHQLVTIMNPIALIESGVPICRTDQHAGEFVITFPRAYHAGFNQGYNFAEAVNFAPADWIKMGRECVSHYSTLHRLCVFSHDEVVCKMAEQTDNLDWRIALSIYHDMLFMVDSELKLRKSLLEAGVTQAKREELELLPDDERQCDYCKTTCFLSAVSCSCSPNVLVCPKHLTKLCQCPNNNNKTMRYRYTLDEFPGMIRKLKIKADSFDKWVSSVRDALDVNKQTTFDLDDLKALVKEAEEKEFRKSGLLQALKIAILEAEKCVGLAQQIENRRAQVRSTLKHDNKCKLTVEDLTLFYEEIKQLACKIKEGDLIRELLDKAHYFQQEVVKQLAQDVIASKEVEELLKTGFFLNIDFDELPKLKEKYHQMRWLEDCKRMIGDKESLTLKAIKRHITSAKNMAAFPLMEEQIQELEQIIVKIEEWEGKTKLCLQSKEIQDIKIWEDLLEEAERINGYLPSKMALREIVRNTQSWITRAESCIPKAGTKHSSYMETVDDLLKVGQDLMVKSDILPKLEVFINEANLWKEKASQLFLRKNSPYSLMEALIPRQVYLMELLKGKKKSPTTYNPYLISGVALEGAIDVPSVIEAFQRAEETELRLMLKVRVHNETKKKLSSTSAKFCICHKALIGNMNECALCRDWYHEECVPQVKGIVRNMPSKPGEKTKPITYQNVTKFMCPMCLRTRRPRLDMIVPLLASTQSLAFRIPEAEALQCMAERAISWQEKSRKVLKSAEMHEVLAQMSVLTMRQAQVEARYKSEVKRNTSKPELQRRFTDSTRLHDSNSKVEDYLSEDSPPNSPSIEVDDKIGTNADNVPHSRTEHAYAAGNLNAENVPHSTTEHAYAAVANKPVKKRRRKSPLVPRMIEETPIILSQEVLDGLKELMVEGDLIELYLEETNVIWRVLQATLPDVPSEDSKSSDTEVDVEKPQKGRAEGTLTKEVSETLSKDALYLEAAKAVVEGRNTLNHVVKAYNLNRSTLYRHLKKIKFEKIINSEDNSVEEDDNEVENEATSSTKEVSSSSRPKRIIHEADKNSNSQPKPTTSSEVSGIKKLKVLKPRLIDKEKKNSDGVNNGKKERKTLASHYQIVWNASNEVKPNFQNLKRRTRRDKGLPMKAEDKLNEPVSIECGEIFHAEEEEELCAAVVCRRPAGSEVDWVQCDGGCELWFHMHCVGLGKDDVNEDEDYICKQCFSTDTFVEEEMDLTEIKEEPRDASEDNLSLSNLISLRGTEHDFDDEGLS